VNIILGHNLELLSSLQITQGIIRVLELQTCVRKVRERTVVGVSRSSCFFSSGVTIVVDDDLLIRQEMKLSSDTKK